MGHENMKKGRGSFSLLYYFIAREFLMSFLVSFLFFFFIFFVNQILVLAREIILKNVSLKTVLYLVVLTIPQFLLYTFPFSSLTAASMTIGDLSSKNEILAIRFSGIHIKHVFLPIVLLSLVFSFSAILISNNLIPYTAEKYKEEYSKILADLPTIEIESYKVNNINDLVISNGNVEGSLISDLTIFDTRSNDNTNAITSDSGRIRLLDLNSYTYELSLDNPRLLSTNDSNVESWGVASAKEMKLFLNFSNLIPSVQSITPSQMSLSQLVDKAAEKEEERKNSQISSALSNFDILKQYSESIHSIQTGNDTFKLTEEKLLSLKGNAENIISRRQVNFYQQYYRSEFHKKVALSLACTFLVFISFPISFFKVRYGRLIGFAISIFTAVAYWFFIFFMQLKSVETAINPAFFIWMPNMVFFAIGLLLVWRLSRQ
ncbi:MAG: LptF/LptG family permease [Sphaerochaetaceae bacterium]|jgi:lipopolysaccharide export system permease protein|nr:LptF/LptG family permease [Sphaerochaetaceae bacterium]